MVDRKKKQQRARRTFTKEFKAEAVALVESSDKTLTEVARDLDLTRSALHKWVKQAEGEAGKGAGEALSSDERQELARLRRENRTLRMERDFLKKTAAFFAKESSQ